MSLAVRPGSTTAAPEATVLIEDVRVSGCILFRRKALAPARHANVHQHHAGAQPLHGRDRVLSRGSLTDHRELVVGVNDEGQPGAFEERATDTTHGWNPVPGGGLLAG